MIVSFSAVVAGAVLLVWPAFYNGYPLVFSDTGGFLEQALMPDIGWDKPWIYGPLLTPFHWRLSLWPATLVQAVMLSAMLWMTQAALRRPRAIDHLILCLVLAVGTAAPWFASLLMPDIFAPITVLGLFVLSFARPAAAHPVTKTEAARAPGAWAIAWVSIVTTIAIATHLAHLVLAAACIAALALLRWRVPWRPAVPLAAALVLIVVTNVVGNGVVAISPYGANFALARLAADGPARDYLQRACPDAGFRLCAWKDRLPDDSDAFLWDPDGPVWANGYGPTRLAPEAARIVAGTIAAEPFGVFKAALRNTVEQLGLTHVGDALGPAWLDVTVLPRLRAYFPPAEAHRFAQSRQARGRLPGAATWLNPLHAAVLAFGTLGTIIVAVLRWRNDHTAATLAVLVLIGLLANAFSTGALSHPHHRYQARIAWLVVLPPFFALADRRRRAASHRSTAVGA